MFEFYFATALLNIKLKLTFSLVIIVLINYIQSCCSANILRDEYENGLNEDSVNKLDANAFIDSHIQLKDQKLCFGSSARLLGSNRRLNRAGILAFLSLIHFNLMIGSIRKSAEKKKSQW